MKKLGKLAALISASLAYEQDAVTNTESEQTVKSNDENSITASVLNHSVSIHLAGHRSHSSHRSHRSHSSHSSHRSSAGGSYYYPSTSESSSTVKKSNSSSQYPAQKLADPALTEKMKNDQMRKNIIMRVQLTLQYEGYYDGTIDGIMGPQTRAGVMAYKNAKGLSGETLLDTATLNALGIVGY